MEPSNQPYEALIVKHLSNSLSPEEKGELEHWLQKDPQNQQLLQELEAVWAKTESYGQQVTPDVAAGWHKVQSKMGLDEPLTATKGKTNVFPMFSATRVAAAIFILAVLTWFVYPYVNRPQMIEVAAGAKETKEVKLPDGSTIWLAQNSTLRYAKDLKTAKQREVELTGEAFFDIAKMKEKPFVIEALETQTEVLGTSFNIQARKEEKAVLVSVVTGKVRFSKGDRKEQLYLERGTQGIYTRATDKLQKTQRENQNFLSWKNGALQFNNTTLQEVLADLGRHYGVQFVIVKPHLGTQRMTTSFQNEPLEDVLAVLQTLLDVQIIKDGATYRVH